MVWRRQDGPRVVLFLHGYCSPGDPTVSEIESAAIRAGVHVHVFAPTAPTGPDRVDPYNPRGLPSWFRYSTDLTASVPQQPDDPHGPDVHEVLYGTHGLLAYTEALVDEFGAGAVAIVGESQGGVMAAFLAMAWTQSHPETPLGGLGLVRTAPHPWTWCDLAEVSHGVPWPTGEGRNPPSLNTTIAVVLGQDDQVFRPYASLYALGPLLENNPAVAPSQTGAEGGSLGNCFVRVLAEVDHVNQPQEVFATLFTDLARG